MKYQDIRQYVESLQLQEGTSSRVDCPVCGARNTFSVTKDYGKLLWQCFRSSCGTRGVKSSQLTAQGLNALLGLEQEKDYAFEIPTHFTGIEGRDKPLKYLADNHCLDAYLDKRADIRYDPKLDRVVFMVKHEGEYHDASGRAMDRAVVPKWYRYGHSDYGFICSHSRGVQGRNACVVEDAASACAVSCVMDGVALLGTNLLPSHVALLSSYDEISIALDPDALDKAFKMQAELSSYALTKIVITEDDPKYFGEAYLRELLEG